MTDPRARPLGWRGNASTRALSATLPDTIPSSAAAAPVALQSRDREDLKRGVSESESLITWAAITLITRRIT